MTSAYTRILLERLSQEKKALEEEYECCSSPKLNYYQKLAILLEEVGEVAHAINEFDEEGLRDELTQVAAVCVGWLESMEHEGRSFN